MTSFGKNVFDVNEPPGFVLPEPYFERDSQYSYPLEQFEVLDDAGFEEKLKEDGKTSDVASEIWNDSKPEPHLQESKTQKKDL